MRAHIDVEKELSSCLRATGALVSDDTKGADKTSNSDFWFPSEGVAAELKVMSKNYFSDTSYVKWLNDLYHKWVRAGLAPRIHKDNTLVNLAGLDLQCYREVENYIRNKIERSFKVASKQAQATKLSHACIEAPGLLILVNDGNYGVVPAMMQNITARSLHKFSGLNTVIYFSVNMPMTSGITDKDVLPWCVWSKSSVRPPVDRGFLDRIKLAWNAHLESLVGESIEEVPGTSDSLLDMGYIKK